MKTVSELIEKSNKIIQHYNAVIGQSQLANLERLTLELNGKRALAKDAVVLHCPSQVDPRGDHQYCPMCLNNSLESVWDSKLRADVSLKHPVLHCPKCDWQGQDRYIEIPRKSQRKKLLTFADYKLGIEPQ